MHLQVRAAADEAAESLDSGKDLLETAAMLPRPGSFNVLVLCTLLLRLPLLTGRAPRQANPVDYFEVAGLEQPGGQRAAIDPRSLSDLERRRVNPIPIVIGILMLSTSNQICLRSVFAALDTR